MQARHPEIVVVSLSVTEDKVEIEDLLKLRKLDTLRVATGPEWQSRFGLSEAIPATVVVDGGRIRLKHQGVLIDPVLELEADLAALHRAAQPTK